MTEIIDVLDALSTTEAMAVVRESPLSRDYIGTVSLPTSAWPTTAFNRRM